MIWVAIERAQVTARRTGLPRDLSITRTHPATRSIKPNDLDCTLVGSSHGRGWLRFTWRTLTVYS
jgi:hypothetical protein